MQVNKRLIIVIHIRELQMPQTKLTDYDDIINALPSDRADASFSAPTLPRQTRRRRSTTNSQRPNAADGLHPGFEDTRLRKSVLALEFHRALISDRRVPAFRILEALDVVEHVGPGLVSRPAGLAVAPLVFSDERKLSTAALPSRSPSQWATSRRSRH